MANLGTAAEKARKLAEKYSGEGQVFHVKYLGTEEVSSAKGDAVIADCLKELRTLFREVAAHLPKVTISLQLSGVTVIDEKSKMETMKVPLDHISYVCLDPGDSSVFSFIIRSNDTISSKGLRLHAFVCHPQTAISFNRSAREVFDFMARVKRAKKKMAVQQGQEGEATGLPPDTTQQLQQQQPSAAQSHQNQDGVPALAQPPPVSRTPPGVQLPPAVVSDIGPDKRQQVFKEWKELEKEIDEIGKELGIPSQEESIISTDISANAPALATQPDITTMSGYNPFENSFFDLSFGTKQPSRDSSTTNTTPGRVSGANPQGAAADPHLFDNPLFNGHSEKTESGTESGISTPLTSSTPDQSKQLVYSSRPRPRGKALDGVTLMSPPPVPGVAATTGRGGDSRVAREVSLSPNAEQEVKSILDNTDPFSPPPPFDAFGLSSNGNGSSIFQPVATPFSPNATANSDYFSSSSVMTQDSIQLVNPLYQSYSPNTSFSAGPFSPPGPPLPQQQQVVYMSPPPPLAMQPPQQFVFGVMAPPPGMIQQVQATPIPAQVLPEAMGAPMLAMGVNTFDGVLMPTTISSPPNQQTGNPSWSPQDASGKAVLNEERDKMFADLLPATALPNPSEKKKEFEPQTPQPTLAQLQENKQREQEATFRGSSSDDNLKEEATEWPQSPFDAHPTTPADSLLSGSSLSSTVLSGGEQLLSTSQQASDKVDTQVPPQLEDFDAAFEEAGTTKDLEGDIDSVFEVKQPHILQSPGPATNDPFKPNDTAGQSAVKDPAPWSTF